MVEEGGALGERHGDLLMRCGRMVSLSLSQLKFTTNTKTDTHSCLSTFPLFLPPCNGILKTHGPSSAAWTVKRAAGKQQEKVSLQS